MVVILNVNEAKAQVENGLVDTTNWIEISKDTFEKALFESSRNPDSKEKFSALGLSVTTNCREICESFLVEEDTGKEMWLPADFDQGIMGISFSPSGTYFMVYSSYDGPDYDNYYDHRAEMHLYAIGKAYGLDAIIYIKSIYTVEWSIDNLTWVNDSSFAVKTYNENRRFNADEMEFKYFKTELK